jgi:hypothetical protein
VTTIVRVPPGATVPSAHGNAVVQSPLVLTNVRPVGVGSDTETPVALDGPLFVSVMVYVTFVPGSTEGGPVFESARSALGASAFTSVLVAAVGSVVPTGGAAVAVLTSEPVAAGSIVPVAVKVTVPLAGRSTVAAMFPLPLAGQTAPPAATQVQVTPVIDAGKLSVTVAPRAVLGPALVAVIVYVIAVPGVAVAAPSVLVMDRSATGEPTEVEAVAVLFAETASAVVLETVAVFTIGSGVVYAPGTV